MTAPVRSAVPAARLKRGRGWCVAAFLAAQVAWGAAASAPRFSIQLDTVTEGYDGITCWAQARAAAVPRPGQAPLVVITMNKLILAGSDVYLPIHETRTEDLGRTWTPPHEHAATLGRRPAGSGVEVGVSDFWPKYHARSGKVLGTGQTFRYRGTQHPEAGATREVVFSVYDAAAHTWSAWATLDLRGTDMARSAGAGCAQRLDLPNGEILLPVSFRPPEAKFGHVRVLRCAFDGRNLRVLAQGPALTRDSKRGYGEPSLARFGGKFFLAVRHDETGYVTSGTDGTSFAPPEPWRWDDGTPLGNYNTQVHWVTHDEGLFLAYTRRGANNDHVYRHRAPLFIAQVDPQTLRVIRATERVLIPERGARYGNFGVCDVNERETWVVETEWMQQPGPERIIPIRNRWGAAARVYASRIQWETPNTGWGR